LTEEDIIDLPALFKLDKGKAMPYFPNMVRDVPAARAPFSRWLWVLSYGEEK